MLRKERDLSAERMNLEKVVSNYAEKAQKTISEQTIKRSHKINRIKMLWGLLQKGKQE